MVASTRAAGAIASLALVAGACAPAEVRVGWSIGFASDVPLADARASVVHATIRAGGCSSTDAIYAADLAFGDAAPQPPALPHGTWGFAAEAVDASCAVIASDCVAVTVPAAGGTNVHLLLRAGDPYPLCAPADCRAGRCGAPDAGGPGDAGSIDASALDSGPRDSGPRDAGPPDACAASESRCTDGADDDCDGATDCADPDCQGEACGAGSLCCSGACVDTRTSDAHCGGCGAACDTAARFACTAGACECEAGWTECAPGSCTRTATSETDCGACGNACAPELVCTGGTCGPDPATWFSSGRLSDCPEDIGTTRRYACPPNPALTGTGNVYGTDTYYATSAICPAAVHAGLITAAAGGVVALRVAAGLASYTGTTRNGITSSSRGSGSCSSTLEP